MSSHYHPRFLCFAIALTVALLPLSSEAKDSSPAKPLVVFVAGKKSHGYGAHEFKAGCLLMQKALRETMPALETKVYLDGWPEAPDAFDGASAIVLFMDGGGGHPVRNHLDQLAPLMDAGVGLMCMHYAVEVPIGPVAKAFLNWIGGYYENDYSINPHWVAKSMLNQDHPISRGVKDFALKDEWYYNMRFREKMDGVVSVLESIPDDEARSGTTSWPRGPKKHIVENSGRKETLLWATERPDGGRGVGFTGAHFHWNFGDPNFRRLVLNAVVWTAGMEVPEAGVPDMEVTLPDLEVNQDFEKPDGFKLPDLSFPVAAKPEEERNERRRNRRPLFASSVINSATPGQAIDIDVDVTGSKNLYLIISDGGDGFSCDWADWVNPRIVVNGNEQALTEWKWKSAQSQWGKVEIGRNAGGGALKVNGKAIENGIGAHANSVIHYELPAGATRFRATGGLDEGGVSQQDGKATSVRFIVQNRPPNLKRLMQASPGAGSPGGMDAGESVASLEVAPGLEAAVFAAEPQLLSPSNIDIDSKGRVWVAEIVNYRGHNGKRPEGDRILILEDADNDGKADTTKVFYQGRDIDSPHGVCVIGNRVIVSANTKVFVFTDTDGDDKPDSKKVLFQGIDGAQHDHGIHAVVFGPDGRLYFNFGNAGRHIEDASGNPVIDKVGNVVAEGRNPYQEGMVFRCNLDGSDFETLGWNFRNNWEVAVDSFGTVWQSDNDDDGNQGVRINYVMEFGNYGYRDEMTGASWGQERTGMSEDRAMRHWHQNDPGVVPNLLHTGAGSPTGITVYEGDLLPETFRNQVIHCDAGPNITRAYIIEKSGAGYSARIENLLDGAKGDRWFRPSDVCVAPDGALFIADWYDPGVGGHGMGDLEKGRIIRLAPKGNRPNLPGFNFDTPEGAVVALKSPNNAIRAKAWLALNEMGATAEAALKSLWSDGNPRLRARALWLLARIDGKGAHYVDAAINDVDPDIRVTGVRLARQLGMSAESIVTILIGDPAAEVRRELAIALRDCKDEKSAAPLWAELAMKHDGKDRWYLEALGIGAANHWDAFLGSWLSMVGRDWNTPAGRDIIWRSRAKRTPELLAKIVVDGGTAEADKPRYMRAFDFFKGAEKEAALQTILLQ
ncbi:MAG: NPCBM/NEW2 domain-containing protein [Verrucomicrobiae bacterium]|nr:NPCBM/NEW2 domain-containing protein [Verrucomicrobiae bacterium]